jgi:hypothetical protein
MCFLKNVLIVLKIWIGNNLVVICKLYVIEIQVFLFKPLNLDSNPGA